MLQQFHDIIEEAHLWENEIDLKRNDFLKVKGSRDSNIYYVLEGSLRIFIEDEYEEHTIRFGYQNNFITALDSFIKDQPSEFYIQALKKTRVKSISKEAFMNLIESDAKLMKAWHQLLGELVYQQLEREKDVLTFSPRDRDERVLKRSPQLFQEIPSKYIASYLRMSPETLSRFKKD
jgi:CRP-like cAMP-binding protein